MTRPHIKTIEFIALVSGFLIMLLSHASVAEEKAAGDDALRAVVQNPISSLR